MAKPSRVARTAAELAQLWEGLPKDVQDSVAENLKLAFVLGTEALRELGPDTVDKLGSLFWKLIKGAALSHFLRGTPFSEMILDVKAAVPQLWPLLSQALPEDLTQLDEADNEAGPS